MTLHISWRRVVAVRRVVDACPTCKRRTRKVAEFEHYYGWLVTCCACGERWQDGEMCPRPFERGWRDRGRAYARKAWREAGDKPRVPAWEDA